MKLRHPGLIRAAAWGGAALVRMLLATLRCRVVSADGLQHPADPAHNRFVYTFWHESLLAPAIRPGRVNVLISLHSDGELIAQVCRHLGIGVVRGSTKRRGGPALLEMLSCGDDAHLAVTPDGPRGPRRTVQVGAVYVASKSGLPVVPIGIGFSRAWRAKSWDRFAVPWPLSRVHGVIGQPLHVPPNLSRDELEGYRQELEGRMLELTAQAEAWAAKPEKTPDLGKNDAARRPEQPERARRRAS